MDAIKFIMTKNRMCKAKGACANCPIDKHDLLCDCVDASESELKKMVEIVEQWGKENPVKTYKDDFMEKFPKAELYSSGAPKCCKKQVYGLEECENDNCSDCWNEPIEFPYKETSGTDEQIDTWIREVFDAPDCEGIYPSDMYEDELIQLCWKVIEGMLSVIETQPTVEIPIGDSNR